MDMIVENLRYVLWRERNMLPRARWTAQLAQWGACSPERAYSVLRQGGLTVFEQQSVAEALHMSVEELLSARLLESDQVDILQENMRYLIGELGWGGPRRLSEALGISPSTVSQWGDGKHRPSAKRLGQICDFFGIARPTDLTERPLFLELEPTTLKNRKEWLKERIDALQPELLQELFPALRRLLGERT
jgi:transcriptional regulator with XRE-family HTH domain